MTYRDSNPTGLSPLNTCKSISCQTQATCSNDTIYNNSYEVFNNDAVHMCSGLKWNYDYSRDEWTVVTINGSDPYCCTSGGYPGTSYPSPGTFSCNEDGCGNGPTTFPCNASSSPSYQYNVEGIVGNAITVNLTSSNQYGYVLGTSAFYVVITNEAGILVSTLDGRYTTSSNLLIYNVAASGTHTVKIWMDKCPPGAFICNSTNYTNIKKNHLSP